MAVAISQNSHLNQTTPKRYHTFQIVNGKKNKNHPHATGLFCKIASFFEHSPPLTPSSIQSTTSNNTISSRVEILNRDNNFPCQKTFYLFYFNIFACSMSFTLIIPSLWSYLRELECTELYLAYCISIYAIGELCGSYLASIIKNKYNTKFVLVFSMLAGIAGGFIYGTAGLVTYYFAPYSVLIGRILQGMWTGMEQYTETKYMSDNIDLQRNANALSRISLVSSIGYIFGPIIGILLQLITSINIGWFTITSNMLCGYFIMLLCTIQIIVTLVIFDNKLRLEVPKRNTFTRTLTIQPRINGAYSTPRYTVTEYTDPSKLIIENKSIADNLTPPPKLLYGLQLYKKKQRKKTMNGYNNNTNKFITDDQIFTFSDASPLSFSQKSQRSLKSFRSNRSNMSRRWLDSASPPSTLPCIPDNFDDIFDYKYYYSENHNYKMQQNTEEKEQSISTELKDNKLKINVNYQLQVQDLESKENRIEKFENRKLTATASYRSFSILSDQNTFHRTSVAEMLNIETPSAICHPYTPYNTTPFTAQGYDMDINTNNTNNSMNPLIGINNNNNNSNVNINTEPQVKYIHTYTTFNKFTSVVMAFCFLIHFEAFSIQQTMTSYLIKRKFDWNVYFAHYLFILCGILWMCSFYLINKLLMSRSVNHNSLVKVSLFLGVISTFCLISITLFPNIQYNEYLYLFGFILISFTFPFGRASVLSLYCLCTNYKYIQWIYLVSMVSRIITPFIGVCLYFMLNGPSWMYGNITVLFMIAIILCSLTTSSIKKQKRKTPEKISELTHGFSIINIPQVFYIQK